MNLRDQTPRRESKRPWQSREEFLVDVSLMNNISDDATIRSTQPANKPQELFPARTGFAKNEWTLEEVLNVDRYTPTYRSWMSGMPVRPSILSDYSDRMWSGAARNAMSEGTF